MRLLAAFMLRWIVTSFGLWLAIQFFGIGNGLPGISEEMGGSVSQDNTAVASVYLMAGFILSLINVLIKPLVLLLSLPITIVTLGLFTIIVNGLMVYFALWLTPGIEMEFWSAVVVGVIIGIVNYAINSTVDTLKTVKG